MLFILSKNKQFQALFFIIITFIFNPLLYANDQIFLLDNGMEVILKENHNSPMVASMVFVKSGSKYESQYENGITHFLEHLLFNGTVHQSREDIEGSIRNLGGYINAFTRKELTAYLVLLPRQYIDFGMTVQVDMLFNSIIPEEELSKERKVVIEEINRDTDSPGSQAEKFFIEKAYTGTPYNRPVLGYKAFINNIPRKAIIDYWKRFYRPDNMILLVIGDFESNEMQQTIESTFGSIKIVDSLAEKKSHLDLSEQTVLKINISGQKVYDTVANVKSTYINFSLNAPHYSDPDYIAFDLLSQYLDMDEISPLMIALKGGLNPLATEASVSLVTYEEFSRLEVSVVTDKPENSQKIVSIITEQMKSVSNSIADNETISGIKTSVKCQDIYISEKLHYLGFMIAPMLMTAGWEFTQDYPEKLEKVMWSDCQKAAQNWLSNPNYIATIVKPIRDSIQIPYSPKEMTPENVAAYFDTTDFQEYNLDTGYSLTFPTTDSVSFDMVDNAEYHREILKNGMTVIIKSRPDSRVFAMNVIGKNRSANEPDDKAGITDFVNRCIAKSTVTRNASELSRDLAKIGANVTLYDNPWIPYDDHYTSQRFSFMKFETIDEFAEKGFHLFTEMILDPAFDSAEVENIRQSMLGVLHRDSNSSSKVAGHLFYKTMFENKAFSRPIMGTSETINSITIENLKKHHHRFYAPQNIILSIVTDRPIEVIRKWVNSRFGRLAVEKLKYNEASPPEPITEIKNQHQDFEKEQINIYLGNIIPGADNKNALAIKVATSILSNRLYHILREKQGLAYSVGASSTFDKNFGWFYSVIGTEAVNYQKAIDGIILQIDKLKLDGPTLGELRKAKNKIWGRLMSAKLSSINQAYYLGLDEYLGHPLGYDKQFLVSLSNVTAESIRRVASKYFRNDIYILATAGKKL